MPNSGVLRDIIYWFINTIGYTTTIKIKDFILFLSGIAVGNIMLILLMGRFLNKVQRVENLGKATSVVFKHEGKLHYYTTANNFHQVVEFITTIAFMPFFKKNQYMLEDEKRTRRFAYIVLVVLLLLIFIGIMLATHPVLLPKIVPPEV